MLIDENFRHVITLNVNSMPLPQCRWGLYKKIRLYYDIIDDILGDIMTLNINTRYELLFLIMSPAPF